MRALHPDQPEALHDSARTRALETTLAAGLPAHTLMARAGEAVSRLALALHPHAGRIWVACGPGNNGGDGLIAALHLHRSDPEGWREICVTHDADPTRLPADAAWALREALAAGVAITAEPPEEPDLVIDALLGLGARPLGDDALAARVRQVRSHAAPLLCVDLPSGLNADTGQDITPTPATGGQRHTLSLLTLKPGLFTAQGRDAAGAVWFEPLQAEPLTAPPCAEWGGPGGGAQPLRQHGVWLAVALLQKLVLRPGHDAQSLLQKSCAKIRLGGDLVEQIPPPGGLRGVLKARRVQRREALCRPCLGPGPALHLVVHR